MSVSVPVVNVNDFFEPSSRKKFIQDLGDAFRQFGFVRVSGHSITPDTENSAYQVVKKFFDLGQEQKRKYTIKGGAGQRGYTPYQSESAKNSQLPDLKEFWHVGRELTGDHPLSNAYPKNIWPEEITEFKPKLLHLYDELEKCANVLMHALALYLDQPERAFTDITDDGNSILRCLYYPALKGQKFKAGAIRAAAHEDINFITLLIASTSNGLQILSEGKWLDVNAEPGELIADSGDMLSRVTNGYIPATTHRVINPDDDNQDRFSMPFFVHPRPEAMLRVLPRFTGEGFPESQPDISGIDFLKQRLEEIGLLKI